MDSLDKDTGYRSYITSIEIRFDLVDSIQYCRNQGMDVSNAAAVLETDDEILLIDECDFQDLLESDICSCKKGILHVQSKDCVTIYNNKYRFHKNGTIEVWLNPTFDNSTFYFRRP